MCGIVATIGRSEESHYARLQALRHRGPDGAGVVSATLSWTTVSLGVTRLAITGGLDVPAPFTDVATGVVVAFNGEVYNWPALRAELADGRPWVTECDVEVVARAWDRWGPLCVEHFNGMFALVLVDPRRDVVFVARDRAGEKPLYYTHWNGTLKFASEAKALGRPLEETPCGELDAFGYDCTNTPFVGISVVPPGHFWVLDGTNPAGNVPLPYWTLPTPEPRWTSWSLDEMTELVRDAIVIRARAAVPVACLVSGGLDSAIIRAVSQAQHLYTTDVDGTPVPPGSTAVSFGLEDALAALPEIAWHLDTPATWTALAQWFLARRIAADGGKVVLSGEGADEVFGGYARYKLLAHLDGIAADPWLRLYGPLREYLLGTPDQILARLFDHSNGKRLDVVERLVSRFSGTGSLRRRAMRVEWHTSMQVLLRMFDRMFMGHGLEGRCPFLDYRIVEAAARIPDDHLVSGAGTKLVLREVARRLGVPAAITDETDKRGFAVPWNRWTNEAPWRPRGQYDRTGFAGVMRRAWREAFSLSGEEQPRATLSAR